MAGEQRKVELVIAAQAEGNDKVKSLAAEIRALAGEGSEAAPKFQALADELDQLAGQNALIGRFVELRRETVNLAAGLENAQSGINELASYLDAARTRIGSFAAAENAARNALDQSRGALAEKRLALQALREETSGAARRSDEYRTAVAALSEQIKTAKSEVREKSEALKQANADLKQAERDEKSLANEYERSVNAAKGLSAALGDKTRALEQARSAMKEAGIDANGLASKEAELRRALQSTEQQGRALAASMAELKRESASMGSALDAAFKTLGVRPVREVTAEIERLQAAMRSLRDGRVLPEDAERATAAYNARLGQLRAELNGAAGAAAVASGRFNETAAATSNVASSMGSAVHKALAWTAALSGFNGLTDVVRNVIDTGAAFQTLEARLTNLLGSSEAARSSFAQIKDLAAKTPFEVTALTEAFVKLTAFGMQPTMQQMQAITDTAATLGGGTEMLSRVTIALGQAWAKGKLQGDEILQMAEAGVPVWDALAHATGKSVPELQKLSEAGRLSRDVIKKLIDELGRMNEGASADQMATFAGAVSNAKDAMAEFFDLIAQSGVLDYLTTQIQGLLAEFDRMKKTGELQQIAKDTADAFVGFAKAVKSTVEVVHSLSGVIKIAIELMAVKKVMDFANGLRSVGAGAKVAAAEIGAANAAMAASGAAQAASAAGAARSGAAVAGAGVAARVAAGAFGLLRTAMSLTLWSVAINGAISLASWLFKAKDEAKGLGEELKKTLDEAPDTLASDAIETVATHAELTRVKIGELAQEFFRLREEGTVAPEALKKSLQDLQITGVDSVTALATSLAQIGGSAQISAREVADTLVAQLKNMPAKELQDFGILADMAFRQGSLSAEQLATLMEARLQAGLEQLGIQAQVTGGGLSTVFVDARNAVQLLIDDYARLEKSGVNAQAVMEQAIARMLAKAANPAEFVELERLIRKMGEAGRLSESAVSEFLDKVRAKADEAKPGINSLAEAFKALGLKSRDELQRAAAVAEDAFGRIKGSGKASTYELQQAFRAYAEAAIAAHGGVATETLKAQAAMQGLTIETDNTGRSIVRSMSEASGATRDTGDAADRAAGSYDKLARSAGRAGDSIQRIRRPSGGGGGDGGGIGSTSDADPFNGLQTAAEREHALLNKDNKDPNFVNRSVSTTAIDFRDIAYRRGMTVEEAERFAQIAGPLFAREWSQAVEGSKTFRNMSAQGYNEMYANAFGSAMEAAAAQVRRESGAPRREREGEPDRGGGGRIDRTIRVELAAGGKSVPVSLAASDEDQFMRILEDAKRRSA